jgi:hypothetical protein
MTVYDSDAHLSPEMEKELVTNLAQLALTEAAPEELVLFPETVEEYFSDPQAILDPKRRDEPVGFGLDLAMLTPYILAAATAVIRFLAATVADAAREELKPVVGQAVGRLLRRPEPVAEPTSQAPSSLEASDAQRIRQVAYQRAKDLGLADAQATLLADSIVGGLIVR